MADAADSVIERKYRGLPRKRTLEDLNRTVVGLVALGVLIVVLATLVIITKVGPGYRHYSAEFIQAAALLPDNPVTVAGIPVGTVTGMKLAGDHVVVDMRIQDDVDLGKDSRAAIMVTTILGSRYLSLHPGGGGPLENNTIDLNHTEVPYDLQQALQDVAVNYGAVDTDKLASAVEALGKQIETLPPMIPKAMDNLRTLSTVMADRRAQLGSMLKTMDLVTTTFRQQLFGEFVARREAFHVMLQSLTQLVAVLDDTVVTNRPQMDALLASTSKLTGLLAQHDDMLHAILQSAPIALRGVANATGTGNSIDGNIVNGFAIDSWMCAISGRAKQFGMIQYFKDCQ